MSLTLSRVPVLAFMCLSAAVFSQTPSFQPDGTFQGTTLTDWHIKGEAQWNADNGVIAGDATTGKAGGWLFFNQSYQDAGLYASFQCEGVCDTGILMRAETSGDYTH